MGTVVGVVLGTFDCTNVGLEDDFTVGAQEEEVVG